jgi:hypothetical protein
MIKSTNDKKRKRTHEVSNRLNKSIGRLERKRSSAAAWFCGKAEL